MKSISTSSLAAIGLGLFVSLGSGCATQGTYKVEPDMPVASIQLESATLPKSGLYTGHITLAMGELDRDQKTVTRELGFRRVTGDELDRQELTVQASRLLQFSMTYSAPYPGVIYICNVPFRAQLTQNVRYKLAVNLDQKTKECELTLTNVSVNPSVKIGTTQESTSYTTFGLVSKTYSPTRPPANPMFE